MVDVPLLSRFTRAQEIASIWPEEITRFPFELTPSISYLLVGHRWPKGRVGKFHLQTTWIFRLVKPHQSKAKWKLLQRQDLTIAHPNLSSSRSGDIRGDSSRSVATSQSSGSWWNEKSYLDYFIRLAALAAALDWDAYLTSDIGSTSPKPNQSFPKNHRVLMNAQISCCGLRHLSTFQSVPGPVWPPWSFPRCWRPEETEGLTVAVSPCEKRPCEGWILGMIGRLHKRCIEPI